MSRRPSKAKIQLALDFLILSFGQIASKALGLVAFGYLARVLGPATYGSVEYAVGLIGFSAMITEFGLGPIGVRGIAEGKARTPVLAANIPVARICIVLACLPMMFGAVLLSHRDTTTGRLLLLYTIALCALPWNLDWLFQAYHLMTRTALAQILRSTIFAGGVLLLVRSPEHALRVGYVEICAAFCTLFYYLYTQSRHIAPLSLNFSKAELLALWRMGLPIGGAQLASGICMFAPMFLVANLAPGNEAGWFAAGHRVTISLSTFSMVYHFNLYPVIAKLVVTESPQLLPTLRASLRVVSWLTIGGTLVLHLLTPRLVQLAWGAEFANTAVPFGILLWFLPITLISGHSRWFLVAAQRQRYAFRAQVVGAIATLIVGSSFIWLGKRFFGGAGTGAALAMCLAALCVWFSSQRAARDVLSELPALSVVAKPTALAGLIGLAALLSNAPPVWAAGAAALIFAVATPLLDRNFLADLRRLLAAKSL